MKAQDCSADLQQQVIEAARDGVALRIHGGDTKSFLGHAVAGRPLDVSPHGGIVSYEPTELVITARAGSSLAMIEQTLAEQGQMLGFEPPYFGERATLGGTIACNLSGPARPWRGAARDFVLGCRLINGKGEILSFGGEVMKNVAGYDVSRLMAGSFGTLGVLLEVSLKVLPVPESHLTLGLECDPGEGLRIMHALSSQPLPLSAACHDGAMLHLRLSGTAGAIAAARRRIGGDEQPQADEWWRRLREQRHGFFAGPGALWRLSLASNAPLLSLRGKWLLDWGGAQRWLRSDESAATVRARTEEAGGHATLYRAADDASGRFHPLPDALMQVQRRLRQAFDPARILNPGRLYPDL